MSTHINVIHKEKKRQREKFKSGQEYSPLYFQMHNSVCSTEWLTFYKINGNHKKMQCHL